MDIEIEAGGARDDEILRITGGGDQGSFVFQIQTSQAVYRYQGQALAPHLKQSVTPLLKAFVDQEFIEKRLLKVGIVYELRAALKPDSSSPLPNIEIMLSSLAPGLRQRPWEGKHATKLRRIDVKWGGECKIAGVAAGTLFTIECPANEANRYVDLTVSVQSGRDLPSSAWCVNVATIDRDVWPMIVRIYQELLEG